MFQIRVLVFVENHPRIHDVVGVEQRLHLAHQRVRLVAPFAPHKRCHIAPRTVLRLQTPVVFVHHQVHHGVHHLVVLRNGFGRVKPLIQNEMVVPLQCMPVNHGIGIMVFAEQPLQVQCRLGEVLDGERDVLNQTRGANLARAAHSGEDARPHRPVFAHLYGVGRERRRLAQRIVPQHFQNHVILLRKFLSSSCFCLYQHRPRVLGQPLQFGEILLHGTHGFAVEKLRSGQHLRLLHLRHRLTRRLRGREQQQRRCRMGQQVCRAHRHGRQERQRAFAAHHQMGDDVKRVVELHKRQYRQARHVLYLILLAY